MSKSFSRLSTLHSFTFVALLTSVASAENWPTWRGPTGDGISTESGFATEWSRETNVRWRVELPEPGNSTPIVWGDRVFVTQQMDGGKRRTLLCLDRKTGEKLWQKGVDAPEMERTHETNPYCSPSPVTDGERVIAWFGSAGLVAFDMEGNQLWQRPLGKVDHAFGYGSSPVIYGELCFLNFGPGTREFAFAVDKQTGEIVWEHEAPRPEFSFRDFEDDEEEEGEDEEDENDEDEDDGDEDDEEDEDEGDDADDDDEEDIDIFGTWSTPIVVSGEVIFCFRDEITAFEPTTGEQIWTYKGIGPMMKATPVAGEGILVALGGIESGSLGLRLGDKGLLTDSHLAWKKPRAGGRIGAGVIQDGHLYANKENGIVECLDLESGEVVWQQRLGGTDGRSEIWSSLILTDGKIYVINQKADVFVLAASPEYQLIATNSLAEMTNSSVVGSQGDLFIRTHEALWCIGSE